MLLPSLLNELSLLPYVILSVLFFAWLEGSVAGVSNRTIDDEFGDEVTGVKPVFLPGIFNIWQGEECPLCPVTPDKTKTFRQTYNAATYKPELGATSIGMLFNGTAIYVFFTIANTVRGGIITTLTECNFTLDGQHAGYYRHDPTPDTNFLYQVPVFKSENLQNKVHSLNISTSGLDYHTFTNFDYAIYTFDDSPAAPPPITTTTDQPSTGTSTNSAGTPDSTTTNTNTHTQNGTATGPGPMVVGSGTATLPRGSAQDPSATDSQGTQALNPAPSNQTITVENQSTPVGTIVGGSVGGVALILLVLLLFILYRRQNRKDKAKLMAVTAAPRSGAMAAAVETAPFMMTTDYGSSYPETMSASGTSSTTPLAQHPNPAARNPKFPPGGYVDPFRDHTGMDSLESSGNGTAGWIRENEGEKVVGQRMVPSASAPTVSSVGVDARRQWQLRRSQRTLGADLETQLREAQEDMRELGVRTTNPRSRDSLADVAQMREQMQLMQEHIMYLQHLQGLAGPPPEYTTAIVERRVEGV